MTHSQQRTAGRIGRAAEYYAAAWLLRHHDVWVADMPDMSPVDFIVIRARDGRQVRVQVKATYRTTKGGHRTVNLVRTNGERYAEDSLDWTIAVDLAERMVWVLPSHLTSKRGRLRLTARYSGYAYDWDDAAPVFA